jgi:hypothetical protein
MLQYSECQDSRRGGVIVSGGGVNVSWGLPGGTAPKSPFNSPDLALTSVHLLLVPSL